MRDWIKDLLFVTVLVGGIAALTLIYSPARGQTCRTHPTYAQTYAQPVVVKDAYAPPVVVKESYAAPVVVKKDKVIEVVVPRFVAVVPLVDLPSYSAAYVGPGVAVSPPQAAAQAAPAGELRQVLNEIRDLGVRIRRLEERGDRPAAKQEPRAEPRQEPPEGSRQEPKDAKEKPSDPFAGQGLPDVRDVNRAHCARCHERGKEQNGGDFVLSEKDGSIVRLGDLVLLDLMIHCEKRTMPKLNKKAKEAGHKPMNDAEIASWLAEAARQRALNKTK